MAGFISVYRSVWDSDIFADEPMSEREAWLWMIAKAAWKPTKHRVGNYVLEVPRGSFFATLRDLQDTFHWKSDKRVRTFLKVLEKEEMILRKTDAGKTQISICNYDKYQDVGQATDARRTHRGRTADALKNKGNKENKENNTSAGARPDDVSADLWEDFKTLRKAKKAPLTEGAIKGIRREAEKVGWSMQDAVQACVTNGWQGFQARYVDDRRKTSENVTADGWELPM